MHAFYTTEFHLAPLLPVRWIITAYLCSSIPFPICDGDAAHTVSLADFTGRLVNITYVHIGVYEVAFWMCLLLRSILKNPPEKKIRATVRKAQRSDMKAQSLRHSDLIPFEKFLYSVAVKCWSLIWHKINHIFVSEKITLIIKSKTASVITYICTFWGFTCFSLNCDLMYAGLFVVIFFQ